MLQEYRNNTPRQYTQSITNLGLTDFPHASYNTSYVIVGLADKIQDENS